MRIFLAGASGAVGRPLVAALVGAGHTVTGMTRDGTRAAALRTAGAEAVVCDVFDAAGLRVAVAAARPEVVIHQLTSLPADLDITAKGVYDANNRVRTEGTRNLVAAAEAAGARRIVAQSIAFTYAPVGGWVKTEDDPLIGPLTGEFGVAVEAAKALERQVVGARGLDGLVLRYGFFYGPGTSYAADGHQASEVRRRRLPVIGRGDAVFSFVHIDDAASAAVAACERGAPGIYNITDDEPAAMRDWLPAYAAAIGAKRPHRVPKLIARIVAGQDVVAFATTLRGASNAKAKRELGWEPVHRTWREGFANALG
jgi:nucleoside-diphosphate-sugar epimerase